MHFGIGLRFPGSPPSPEELRALVAEAVRSRLTALTYRLTGTGRRACWEPDPAFDPAHHIDFHRLPPGADVRQAAMEAMRQHPLSRERPLWSLLVLHGYAGDEHVLYYRAHHAFQDGIGAVATIRALTDTTPPPTKPTDRPPHAPADAHETSTTRPNVQTHQPPANPPMPEAQEPPADRPATGNTPADRPTARRWWASDGRRGAGVRRALGGLLRLAGTPPRWFASCAATVPERTLHVARLDIEPFHAIAHATGASLAQIGITIVTGALRSWHPETWDPETWDPAPEAPAVGPLNADPPKAGTSTPLTPPKARKPQPTLPSLTTPAAARPGARPSRVEHVGKVRAEARGAGKVKAGKPRGWMVWRRRREMVVALPVGLRGDRRHPVVGNHTGLLPITLPCDEPAPMARLRRVIDQTNVAQIIRTRQAANDLYRIPAGITVGLLRLLSPLLRKNSAERLNLSAIRLTRLLPDAEEIFAVPPLAPGVAGMVVILHTDTAVSFSGVFAAGVCGTERLPGLLGRALMELHAAATR
ncbi:wax ester/triacylglycerol synthase domain-containing protein [Nonomuraea purpurea]|uniref:Wax ester/triacylglycerol synthase domain-containing protein n=1 Tax=Nonomuraea purpurea TaxID=1849276 RepID=A0ABV8GNQ8_9ACTN